MMRFGLAVAVLGASGPVPVLPCTRVLFNVPGYPVVSGRTMDWEFPFNDSLLINPRGGRMDGGLGSSGVSKVWTVKYGSVVSSINTWLSTATSSLTGEYFDYVRDGGTDGINEAGFGAKLLYLEATQYGSAGAATGRPEGVTYARLVRYLLDTCATVGEAVAAMRAVWVAGVKIEVLPGAPAKALGSHVAVEDASGDSAVFEFEGGEVMVYWGRNYTVMANDPPMPEQIANLRRYQPFTRVTVPPGDIASTSRFVRTAYFLSYLPRSTDGGRMVAEVRSVIETAAAPLGAPADDDPELGVYPTWWTSVTNYRDRVYYWGWSLNPNFVWVDVVKLQSTGKFDEPNPTRHLDPLDASLFGEVSGLFKPIADSVQLHSAAQACSGYQAASAALGLSAVAVGLLVRIGPWRALRADLSESASVERLLA